MTALTKFKATCHKHLVIEDDRYIDVVFGVVFANRLNSKPVWLYLVGPPSGGKTEVIQSLSGHSSVFSISKITPKTLISGWKRTSKTDKTEYSLLPQLHNKILVIKDFTALLSMRSDAVQEILGTLRDAYDGESTHGYGTGERLHYRSKFGVIAAVTNVIDRHRGLLAELGERFLTYRLPDIGSMEEHKRCLKAAMQRDVVAQEREMRQAASAVLDLDPPVPSITQAQINMLAQAAKFAARARCEVYRDRYSKEAEFPHPEVPTRFTKQLTDLALGLTMVREGARVGNDEINIIRHIAAQSITYKRMKLFQVMCELGETSVPELNKHYPLSETQLRRELDDLVLLDLAERRNGLVNGRIGDLWWFKAASVFKKFTPH